MRFEMKMPDLGATESEIRIVRWIVQPGQKVERGEPLLEVETDKATMEVESAVSGVLADVRSRAGEEVSVGQVIAVVETEGISDCRLPILDCQSKIADQESKMPSPSSPSSGRPAGMFARNRAAAAGIPLSLAQRTAARRLQESKQTVPHFYLQTSADASAIVTRRKAAEPATLAWDAFFVLAVARAIAKFERFRCRLDGERLVPAKTEAIGVAADLDGELFVIPIASPSSKTVRQISDELRLGVERLRRGDPEARLIRPTLMTVSNLGVCNVESFIPIINPPEAAVLGVGRVRPTPVAHDDGRIGVERRCTLTLSVDHRVASGRYAGEFLGEIVRQLESLGEGDL